MDKTAYFRFMLVCKTIAGLQDALTAERKKGRSIGFVPTMGALHPGHLSLVERSTAENDFTVVSIFVNPTQFNNPEDLKNYPRMPDEDTDMLEVGRADLLFIPEVNELYTPERLAQKPELNLGSLATVMEGAFRPGHFDGVVQVVYLFFDLIKPDRAYFGEKDFQQLAVIRYMTDFFKMKIDIIGCPTIREADGLAMSSRNLRLNETERKSATIISKALKFVRENKSKYSPVELKRQATEIISSKNLKVEYIEIADEKTMEPITHWNSRPARAFAAVYCGPVRLIDNIAL